MGFHQPGFHGMRVVTRLKHTKFTTKSVGCILFICKVIYIYIHVLVAGHLPQYSNFLGHPAFWGSYNDIMTRSKR